MDTNINQYQDPTNLRHIENMAKALNVSKLSNCLKRHVGVVIMDYSNNVLSSGYNELPFSAECLIQNKCVQKRGLRCDAKHAELMALAKLQKDNIPKIMYCTHEPCIECCMTIYLSNIDLLVLPYKYKTHEGIMKLGNHINIIYLE